MVRGFRENVAIGVFDADAFRPHADLLFTFFPADIEHFYPFAVQSNLQHQR